MKKERVNTSQAEIYTIKNFLSDKECDLLIKRIDENNVRSQVSGGKFTSGAGVSKVRTSSTSNMKHQDFPEIREIDRKISRAINIPLELGEITQGQKYEVGQEFKDHTDYFGQEALKGHGDKWGNRTWTFMIYLNQDLEGGETEFKRLNIKFKPEKGMAVIWKNTKDNGEPNPQTLHAGRPVLSGIKYIITKWFREHPVGAYPLSEHFKAKYPHLIKNGISSKEEKVFHGHSDFPTFTKVGFELRDVPTAAWELIQSTYETLKAKIKPEVFKGQLAIIYDKEKKESPVDLLDLGQVKHVKDAIHKMLKPILEEWAGEPIIPSMIYGIRSYKRGAILTDHKDRPKTHHISAIIIVDEESNKPWPLDIQDHTGKWHKVYAKPGQMILYESCACQHGRLEEFDGNYFRNMFVHYQLRDWKYVSE